MKCAVITGASAGFGWELALRAAEVFPELECLILVARRRERLDALVPLLAPRRVEILPLDLTERCVYAEYAAFLARMQPEIHLLVNNAGCGFYGDVAETEVEQQLAMTELNVTAMTAVAACSLPYMAAGAHILNTSSIAAFVPTPRMTVYSATKAYVSAFSRGLHEELRPRGISVTAVCPCPMRTEFLVKGNITGHSKAFETLPYCDPKKVALTALQAAKKGRAVYTPKFFYKAYRVLAALVPHALMVKISKV